jgi:hypothetical protein
VPLLKPQDCFAAAEEHQPAILALHVIDVFEGFARYLLLVAVHHAVCGHRC